MKLSDYTDIIIAYLEGGYYHPNMKSKLRNGSKMGNSGETMFGLDRVNGKPGVTTYWNPFWQIVDEWYSDKHDDTSYYQHKADGTKGIPAEVGEQLRDLTNQEMARRFDYYMNKTMFFPDNESSAIYLSDKEKNYIYSHPSILLNMYYATWGGTERFKQLAAALHEILKTSTDENDVWEALQKKRISVGATQSATNLEIARQQLPAKENERWFGWALALLGVGVIYLIVKKR